MSNPRVTATPIMAYPTCPTYWFKHALSSLTVAGSACVSGVPVVSSVGAVAIHGTFIFPCTQVGKLLAELVREPLGPGAGGGSSSRREVNAGSEPGSAGNMGE